MSALLTGLAIAGASGYLNNMLARQNATTAFNRQKDLMNRQNEMNNANIMNAPQLQVQGLRMAGFNPAMVAGAGSASPATVSQGNADSAQTQPLNISASDALLNAQRENLEAQTEKLKAEVPRTQAETSNVLADTLFKNAGTKQREAETERMKQINSQYEDQNKKLAEYGKVIGQKWQSSPWYDALLPDTKASVDAIADGSAELSVGGMDALERAIKAQSNLSDADSKLVSNGFANAIIGAQFSDEAVMKAIAQEPRDKQKLLYKNFDQIDKVMKKIDAEIPEIVAKADNTRQATEMLKKQIKSFESSDLGYLKAKGYEDGNFMPWIEEFAERRLEDVFDLGKSYVLGRGLRAGQGTPQPPPENKPMIFKPTAQDYDRAFPRGSNGKPWWK